MRPRGAAKALRLALAAAALSAAAWALPSPPGTQGAGWKLKLPGKAPLLLPALGKGEGPLYPVREAALFAGLSATWRAQARTLSLGLPSGGTAYLVLGETWLAEGLSRTALPTALAMAGGAPALEEASLRVLLARLCPLPPEWEAAGDEEMKAALLALAPRASPAAEPVLEEEAAPVIAPPSPAPAARRRGPVRTIVLDAGHGGHDPGAMGPKGLREKDACLDITLRLKRELERTAPEVTVLLTRQGDQFLSLRQRTELANQADADVFVSVHNNASRDRHSHGSQVFFYDSRTSDKAAADLAFRENADANFFDILMMDLAKLGVRDESMGLATSVQEELGKALHLKDRRLSYAPFYVLARTKMPAILVEVAFVTNPKEERLLAEAAWRQKVAESLARGLADYRRLAGQSHGRPGRAGGQAQAVLEARR